MHEKIVVAVDIGTSQITAVAARKNERVILSVLAVETVKSEDCVLRGRIYNVGEVTSKIEELISSLEKKTGATIERMYVGVGGQSVRSIPHIVARELEEETPVSQKLLDDMLEECLNHEPEGITLLGTCAPEYIINGRHEQKPKGVICQKIEAQYPLIVGRLSYEKDLTSVEKNSGIDIEGKIPSIEAVAKAVLTPTEKDSGCILIDFGAGTTEAAIYKKDILRFYTTLPVGSDAITKDLVSLNMTEEVAETFKTTQGEATSTEAQKENQVIEARTDEILTNIIAQVRNAGFEAIPAEGVVITGGGAKLKGLVESMQDRMKCKVRMACPQDTLFIREVLLTSSPQYAQIAGLLALAEKNCVVVTAEKPQVEQPKLFEDSVLVNKPISQPTKLEKPQVSTEQPGDTQPPKEVKPKNNVFRGLIDKVEKKVNGISGSLFGDDDFDNA